jgi:hypothetical protein
LTESRKEGLKNLWIEVMQATRSMVISLKAWQWKGETVYVVRCYGKGLLFIVNLGMPLKYLDLLPEMLPLFSERYDHRTGLLIDLLASNKVRNLLRQQVRIFKSVYC